VHKEGARGQECTSSRALVHKEGARGQECTSSRALVHKEGARGQGSLQQDKRAQGHPAQE